MTIQLKLQTIRITTRKHGKTIVENIIENHIQRNRKITNPIEMCSFCSSTTDLTKEHVLPRWVFNKSTTKFFTTDVNGLDQTYNKTTISACSSCNSDLLSSLEKYINQLFSDIDLKTEYFSIEQIENIIRWLEVIDYKFQILNVKRKFRVSKKGGYIPYLADFPLSILRRAGEYTSEKVIAEIRRSQKRISTKSKTRNINSLVIFKTKNKDFFFFSSHG